MRRIGHLIALCLALALLPVTALASSTLSPDGTGPRTVSSPIVAATKRVAGGALAFRPVDVRPRTNTRAGVSIATVGDEWGVTITDAVWFYDRNGVLYVQGTITNDSPVPLSNVVADIRVETLDGLSFRDSRTPVSSIVLMPRQSASFTQSFENLAGQPEVDVYLDVWGVEYAGLQPAQYTVVDCVVFPIEGVAHGYDTTFRNDTPYPLKRSILSGWSLDELGWLTDAWPAQEITRTVMPGETIRVTFRIEQYGWPWAVVPYGEGIPVIDHWIAASTGANGSISPAGTSIFAHGEDATYTIKPALHYRVKTLVVDGVSIEPTTTYVFKNTGTNHSIRAEFERCPTAVMALRISSLLGHPDWKAFRGDVAPPHAIGKKLVTLKFYKRNSAGKYVYSKSVVADATRTIEGKTYFLVRVRFSPGRWRVRAYHSDADHWPSYSGYSYFTTKVSPF